MVPAITAFPMPQCCHRKTEARRKLLLRQTESFTQLGNVHSLRGVDTRTLGRLAPGMGLCLQKVLANAVNRKSGKFLRHKKPALLVPVFMLGGLGA